MSQKPPKAPSQSWVDAELRDSFDEELEMEIDDQRVTEELREIWRAQKSSSLDRRTYFRELLRLQAELVHLPSAGEIVLFEGATQTALCA